MFYDLMAHRNTINAQSCGQWKARNRPGKSLAPARHQRFSCTSLPASLGFKIVEFEAFSKLKRPDMLKLLNGKGYVVIRLCNVLRRFDI